MFTESEAFLALTSVSSFVHLLLKQIQEKIAFNKEQERLLNDKQEVERIKEIFLERKDNFYQKIIKLLREFVESIEPEILFQLTESDLAGMLHAYLTAVKDLHVQREPILNTTEQRLRPDFILSFNNERMILELKSFRKIENIAADALASHVYKYLAASDIDDGIMFCVGLGHSFRVLTNVYSIGLRQCAVYLVTAS